MKIGLEHNADSTERFDAKLRHNLLPSLKPPGFFPYFDCIRLPQYLSYGHMVGWRAMMANVLAI